MRRKNRITDRPNTVDMLLLGMPKEVVIVSITVLVIVAVILLTEVSASVSVCRKFGYLFK